MKRVREAAVAQNRFVLLAHGVLMGVTDALRCMAWRCVRDGVGHHSQAG